MQYNEELIKFVQRELSDQSPVKLVDDGIIGEKTLKAFLFIDQIPNTWNSQRKVVGYIQYLCATEGINAGPIDGWIGPQTEYGYEKLRDAYSGKEEDIWRNDEGEGYGTVDVDNDWPLQTQTELEQYYGQVGENQVTVELPYRMKLAWNRIQIVKKVTCHKKVADSLLRIFESVLEQYGEKKIKDLGLDVYGGMLNVRKMRGGTNWSTHSWGIAIDMYPECNKLRWNHTKAIFATKPYTKFLDLFEEEGWVSLGKARDYDWMHFQAAKVKQR